MTPHTQPGMPLLVAMGMQKIKESWQAWALAVLLALVLIGVNTVVRNQEKMEDLIRSHIKTTNEQTAVMRERITQNEIINRSQEKCIDRINNFIDTMGGTPHDGKYPKIRKEALQLNSDGN